MNNKFPVRCQQSRNAPSPLNTTGPWQEVSCQRKHDHTEIYTRTRGKEDHTSVVLCNCSASDFLGDTAALGHDHHSICAGTTRKRVVVPRVSCLRRVQSTVQTGGRDMASNLRGRSLQKHHALPPSIKPSLRRQFIFGMSPRRPRHTLLTHRSQNAKTPLFNASNRTNRVSFKKDCPIFGAELGIFASVLKTRNPSSIFGLTRLFVTVLYVHVACAERCSQFCEGATAILNKRQVSPLLGAFSSIYAQELWRSISG